MIIKGDFMANTSLLQVRVDAADREKATEILESLGTNLSAAVNMLIKQIIITEGIPFEIKKAPASKRKPDHHISNTEDIIVIEPPPARFIPAIEYTNIISQIPEGKVSRYEDIDEYFREKYQAERVETDYSGWPLYDNEGKRIPDWRIIGSRGAVTGAHFCNADSQRDSLEKEGVEIVPYKKSYRVVDYKKYLYTFTD